MSYNLIKSWLYSIGIAFIISAPISGAVIREHSKSQEITIEYESFCDAQDLAFQRMEQIAHEEAKRVEAKAVLVSTEETRQELLINDAQYTLEVYQVEVPEDIREYCEKAGAEFNICPELLEAICWKESRFVADVESKGCSGLMQISVKWHKKRMKELGVTNIYDPEGNIRVGASYLVDLFAKHDGDLDKVLKEYNGDTSKGVSTYALEIMEVSEALERVHGK